MHCEIGGAQGPLGFVSALGATRLVHWLILVAPLCLRSHNARYIMLKSLSLTVAYSIIYSGSDQRKHQSSASLAFVWGIHRPGEFPAQRASNAENVSIWGRYHGMSTTVTGVGHSLDICFYDTGTNLTNCMWLIVRPKRNQIVCKAENYRDNIILLFTCCEIWMWNHRKYITPILECCKHMWLQYQM